MFKKIIQGVQDMEKKQLRPFGIKDKLGYLFGDFGNDFTSASAFSKIKGVYFNPKWSEEAHCQKSYWSLEIADVCSYPIHKYLCYDKKDPAFLVVEKKLRCYPRYIGRGLKIFP